MSEMGFYSLRTGKVTKKTKKKKEIEKFPYWLCWKFLSKLANSIDTFMCSDFYDRIANILVFPQKIFRNISLQPVILARECKQI